MSPTLALRLHLALLLGLAACASTGPTDLVASHLDPGTDPAVDFFQYANGGWIASNPIPPSEASWTIGHLVLDELYTTKRTLNERAAAAAAAPGSDEQKIGDFWTVAMDEALAERLGVEPLRTELDAIAAIETPADAIRVAATLHEIGVGAFWSLWVGQDLKDSERITVTVYQGGLGLPERDYYFDPEEGVARARAAYPAHVARMLELIGAPSASTTESGQRILQFETALAEASRTLAALRDPYANYNPMPVAELVAAHTPHIDWRAILDAHGLAAADTVVVGQPEFLAALDRLLTTTPIDVIRDYLRFHLVREYASCLGKALDDEAFAFYGTVLRGAREQRPRWKRVLDAEEGAMGMILGRMFVADRFPPATRKRYDDLVEAIRDTYREHILALDWMSEATKAKALEKLARMSKKVGYPDTWKDYSQLTVARDSYAANMLRAARWAFADNVAKYGKPVDRTEWDMTPQTYNAYYNPSNNEIVLPAGIFIIPGIADADLDDAVVYGYAAASTIGHEITHGFDDEGRKFDVNGNLAEWWTPEDAARFEERAAVMVRQFDAFEPIPGLHIDGRATLGENIADLGGVVLGLDAFKKTAQYREGRAIAGLTPTQRYFLGYALGWLGHQREELLRQRLLSDVHSPAKWRVNGPFANVPEFHAAFGVEPGDPMWRAPADRVRIW